jgi:hypothetical protein
MSNRNLPQTSACGLSTASSEDQDGYARYYARAQAEAEHYTRKRAERAVSDSEVE